MKRLSKIFSVLVAAGLAGCSTSGTSEFSLSAVPEEYNLASSASLNEPYESQTLTRYGNRWSIPERAEPEPNLRTLRFFLRRYLTDYQKFDRYEVSASGTPSPLSFAVREDPAITQALNRSAMLSYIRYENGQIVVDAMSPDTRFGGIVDNETALYSMSVGKSVISYLLGHAICEGHVSGVDHRISDWPLMRGTLYQDATLKQLIDMRARDQAHLDKSRGLVISGRWPNNFPLEDAVTGELAGTRPAARDVFNYNPLPPNMVLSYLAFRLGGKAGLETFMADVFNGHVGTEAAVFFLRQRGPESAGPARATLYATRYDYLRIARAMLEDWRADTCTGRYLKALFNDRRPKNDPDLSKVSPFGSAQSYSGFFHAGYRGTNRAVLGMDGYGGQSILINFEAGRIISVHAVHHDYAWQRLVLNPILSE